MDGLKQQPTAATVSTPDLADRSGSRTAAATAKSTPLRRLGPNLNHWYVVAQSTELAAQPLA
ncbi:MAG: hypothetical protein AAFW95_14195, partial [Cyanobacteria bacterium J06638_6]